MLSKSLASAVACSLSLIAVACGSAPSSEAVSKSGQAATTMDPAFTICAFDSDCVAVPQAGCCPTGYFEAVTSCEVDAYQAANACPIHNMMCMHHVVNDTRVAVCDDTASACQMVAPESIRCGGDSLNAHSCPSGYDCVLGQDDTTVGNCAKHVDAPAPTDDAGTTTAN